MYDPLLQVCCSVFPKYLLKDLLVRSGEMSAVLIFKICSVYEIVAYGKDGRYGLEISWKN